MTTEPEPPQAQEQEPDPGPEAEAEAEAGAATEAATEAAPAPESDRIHLYWLALATLAATFLACWNLDNTYFWDDESYTALFTKNLIEQGTLTGWDDRNLITFRQGSLLDEKLESINPPLGYLICAAGFKLLGYSAGAGRLPFALLGVLTVPLTFLLVRRLFPGKAAIASWSAAALALNVSFLLYIKQCRYYSPVIFFGTLTLLLFLLAMQTKSERARWPFALAVSAALLFYAHYMIGIAMLLTLAILFAARYARGTSIRGYLHLLLAGLLVFALTFPYAIVKQIWVRPDFQGTAFSDRLTLFWWHVRDLNTCAWLPWTLVAAGAVLVYRSVKKRGDRSLLEGLATLGVFFVGHLAVITLLSPQNTRITEFADMRYLIVLLPLCAVCAGIALDAIVHAFKERWAGLTTGGAVLFFATFTTWLTLTPARVAPGDFSSKPRPLLPAYFREITRPYPEAFRVASEFIRENLPKDATVLALPDYMNYPLMFYTGDHVFFRGQLSRVEMLNRNPGFNLNRALQLDPRLFIDNEAPDYIIAFGLDPNTRSLPQIEALVLRHGYDPETGELSFRYHLGVYLDVYAFSLIRPELFWRSFSPITQFDRQSQAVYVFEKIPVTAKEEAAEAPKAEPASEPEPEPEPEPRIEREDHDAGDAPSASETGPAPAQPEARTGEGP